MPRGYLVTQNNSLSNVEPLHYQMKIWCPTHNTLDRIIWGCIMNLPSASWSLTPQPLESAHVLDKYLRATASFYCDL